MSMSDEDRERLLDAIDEVQLVPADGRGPMGWVYFIVCTETGRCKIGFTRHNVEKRIAGLQMGSASQLALLAMHPGTTSTERRLHEKFGEDRLHGEWFKVSDQLRAYLVVTVWSMLEFALKTDRKPEPWMTIGASATLESLGTISESLAELLEAGRP